MRKGWSIALAVAVSVLGVPFSAGAAVMAQGQSGSLNGVAEGASKQPLPNYTVQIRNVASGQISGTTTSNAAGSFAFPSLQPGNYMIEVLDATGKVVGTSASVSVTAGAAISVTVSATAAGAIAAASAGGFSLLGLGPLATVGVISAAGVATVAGVVKATNDKSPSK